MNDLQKYLELKGITVRELARAIGRGYHSTQKVVKGVRSTESTQAAIANNFGVSHENLWGKRRSQTIKGLVKDEIVRQESERTAELERLYCD